MKSKYKVIIVGAGPSGLSTAINLLEHGIKDIVVVEKGMFPRYKCCAGYITNKTKREFLKLHLDIEKCHYSLIKDFNIYYNLELKQNIKNKFLYTNEVIDRVELDNAFFEVSKSLGIKFLENRSVVNNDFSKNTITLNDERVLEYEYLVFADGMSGYGSKFQNFLEKNIAMQVKLKSNLKDSIQIHFGLSEAGYVWVSTFKGITNVGLTDVYKKDIDYIKVLKGILDKANLRCDLREVKGAFTPIGVGDAIMYDNVFFVGDAVGACDPLTLSGLRYGLKTGEMCALSISSNKPKIYIKYIKKLKRKFKFMKHVQKKFYLPKTLNLIFNVGCKYFKGVISLSFNNFFVNKK